MPAEPPDARKAARALHSIFLRAQAAGLTPFEVQLLTLAPCSQGELTAAGNDSVIEHLQAKGWLTIHATSGPDARTLCLRTAKASALFLPPKPKPPKPPGFAVCSTARAQS